MQKIEKAKRVSALLAAVVWSVAILLLVFPRVVITQAPAVTQTIGAPEQFVCPNSPGMPEPYGALGVRVSTNETGGLLIRFGASDLGSFCVLPGGYVSVTDTGSAAIEVVDDTYNGTYAEASGGAGAGAQVVFSPTFTPPHGTSPLLNYPAPVYNLTSGATVTIHPAHSGYILFGALTPSGLLEDPTIVEIVIAQPMAFPPSG